MEELTALHTVVSAGRTSKVISDVKERARRSLINQEKRIELLRQSLAQNQNVRYKDFDSMVISLRSRILTSANEVLQALDVMEREIGQTSLDGTAPDLTGLQQRKAVADNLTRLLLRFFLQQQEITVALETLLARRETLRVRDFRMVMEGLFFKWEARDNYLRDLFQVLWSLTECVDRGG